MSQSNTVARLLVGSALGVILVLPIAAQASGKKHEARKVVDSTTLPAKKALHATKKSGKKVLHSAKKDGEAAEHRIGHMSKQIDHKKK